jgi:hypothetical protein
VFIVTHTTTSTLPAETLTIYDRSPVPKYASACPDPSRYASACDCVGITASSFQNIVTVTSDLTVYTVPLITVTKSWSTTKSRSADTSSNYTPSPSSDRTSTTYGSQSSSYSTVSSSSSVLISSSSSPSSSTSPSPSPSPSPSCNTYLLQARYGINAGGEYVHISPGAIGEVYQLVFDTLPFGDRSQRTQYQFTLDAVGRLGSNINGNPFYFEANTPTSTPHAVIDVADSFMAPKFYPLNCSIDAGSSELSCSVENGSGGHDTTNFIDCTYEARLLQGTDTSASQCTAAQIVAIPDC